MNIYNIYWKYLASPEAYARHLGVNIGNNCLIATKFWPSEPYLITIGSNCQITAGVRFHTHGGGNIIRRQHPEYDAFGKIIIEDWVYIGAGSQIMPGVTIGEGSLIAAGSIVTKSVPPGVVVGGNPAKIICSVSEYLARNISYDLGTKHMSPDAKKTIPTISSGV